MAKRAKTSGSSSIEKNIPIPPRKFGRGSARHEFAELQVGDSFVIKTPNDWAVSNSMSYYQRKLGYKYTQRREGPDSYRVWRIA
jgi:hypothetical protein